jgi:all-trans-retinol 13,14-reductase
VSREAASNIASRSWDAIIIGSGMGGLSTAAYLATNGIRVLVLEQHEIIGGCSQVFRRKNRYEFDAGVHYLGDCGRDGVIPTVLRGVGLEGKVEFVAMDPDAHETMQFPDFTFRMPKGWDRYLEELLATFPSERTALERCVGDLRRVGETVEQAYAPTRRGWARDLVLSPGELAKLGQAGLLTVEKYLSRYGLSPQARAVISIQTGYTGGNISSSPAALLAFLLHHYLKDGGFYPKGGGQVMAAHLADVIRSNGGDIRTKARVERILVTDRRVTGVRLTDGEVITAPRIVSNADVKRTYVDLIGSQYLRGATVRRAERWRMGDPTFSVYLGLDIDLRETLTRGNYWYSPSYTGHWELADPQRFGGLRSTEEVRAALPEPGDFRLWATSGSVKDPEGHIVDPQGHSTLEVMSPVFPYYQAWGIDEGPAEGEKYAKNSDYLQLKRDLTERLIEGAYLMMPQIKGHIVYQEASTPISHERYTLSSSGSWGGITVSLDQLLHRPRFRTQIGGLYLAGANTTYGPGIVGTLRGGVAAASSILGRNLWMEVREGKVFGDRSRLTAGGPGWDPFFASKRLSVKPRSTRSRDPKAPADLLEGLAVANDGGPARP